MLKSLFLEEFAALDLNMTGFSEVVQRSHTGGSLIHTCKTNEPKKIIISHEIFSHFLKLNPIDFLCVDRGTGGCYSC